MEVFLTFRGFSADLIAVSSELRAAGSSKLLRFVEKPDKKKNPPLDPRREFKANENSVSNLFL